MLCMAAGSANIGDRVQHDCQGLHPWPGPKVRSMFMRSMTGLFHTRACLQRIELGSSRTFQQPLREPLGTDWGAEVRMLMAAQQASAAAMRRSQSNADPEVAAVRGDLGYVQRVFLSLPEGDERDDLQQSIKGLRSKAEQMAAAAQLQPTATRAGKQERRQNGRPEGQRISTALHPGRTNTRKRVPLAQQQAAGVSDPFTSKAKKGKDVRKVGRQDGTEQPCMCRLGRLYVAAMNPRLTCFSSTPVLQVRGPTVPGNLDGTMQRNGAPHHRRKRQRVQ